MSRELWERAFSRVRMGLYSSVCGAMMRRYIYSWTNHIKICTVIVGDANLLSPHGRFCGVLTPDCLFIWLASISNEIQLHGQR